MIAKFVIILSISSNLTTSTVRKGGMKGWSPQVWKFRRRRIILTMSFFFCSKKKFLVCVCVLWTFPRAQFSLRTPEFTTAHFSENNLRWRDKMYFIKYAGCPKIYGHSLKFNLKFKKYRKGVRFLQNSAQHKKFSSNEWK